MMSLNNMRSGLGILVWKIKEYSGSPSLPARARNCFWSSILCIDMGEVRLISGTYRSHVIRQKGGVQQYFRLKCARDCLAPRCAVVGKTFTSRSWPQREHVIGRGSYSSHRRLCEKITRIESLRSTAGTYRAHRL